MILAGIAAVGVAPVRLKKKHCPPEVTAPDPWFPRSQIAAGREGVTKMNVQNRELLSPLDAFEISFRKGGNRNSNITLAARYVAPSPFLRNEVVLPTLSDILLEGVPVTVATNRCSARPALRYQWRSAPNRSLPIHSHLNFHSLSTLGTPTPREDAEEASAVVEGRGCVLFWTIRATVSSALSYANCPCAAKLDCDCRLTKWLKNNKQKSSPFLKQLSKLFVGACFAY